MFASFILVLREVLEASLIIGVVASASRGLAGRSMWIVGGIGAGIVGAGILALAASALAQSFDGMGQEWFAACVLLAATGLIAWHVGWMSGHGRQMAQRVREQVGEIQAGRATLAALGTIVALCVLREGSEIVLFGMGLWQGGAAGMPVAMGAIGGLLVGGLMGWCLYLGLLRLRIGALFRATNVLLVLVAGGLAAQAAGYLSQAQVLPSLGDALWDTSWLLSQDSVIGQAFHVLVGYMAQPSGIELLFYAATVSLLAFIWQHNSREAAGAKSGEHHH